MDCIQKGDTQVTNGPRADAPCPNLDIQTQTTGNHAMGLSGCDNIDQVICDANERQVRDGYEKVLSK